MSITLKSLRSHRVFGIAIFDLTLGAVGMALLFLLAWRLKFHHLSPAHFLLAGVVLTIPVGIAVHVLTGTNTTLNYRLGLSGKPSN